MCHWKVTASDLQLLFTLISLPSWFNCRQLQLAPFWLQTSLILNKKSNKKRNKHASISQACIANDKISNLHKTRAKIMQRLVKEITNDPWVAVIIIKPRLIYRPYNYISTNIEIETIINNIPPPYTLSFWEKGKKNLSKLLNWKMYEPLPSQPPTKVIHGRNFPQENNNNLSTLTTLNLFSNCI